MKRLLYVKNLVKTHRLQYAAKVARDLVLNVRNRCIRDGGIDCWKDMSKLTVVGFSLGAHIASQACIDLYECTGEKVGKLIGEKIRLDLFYALDKTVITVTISSCRRRSSSHFRNFEVLRSIVH